MKEITKKYSNEEITIVWKPSLCIHSTLCWKKIDSLPDVFNPKEKPWIKPYGADSERIIEQVNKCPSGALSYYMNNADTDKQESLYHSGFVVEVMKNGPLLIHGEHELHHSEEKTLHQNKVTAFCRCGASANKPYCDGSHLKIDFIG